MSHKKIILELLITFFISYFLYSLVDFSAFSISEWNQDKIFNLTHTWFILISSYYIYNGYLKLAFDYWKNISIKKLILLLIAISFFIIFWTVVVDIFYYKLYYNITSLHEETTFFDFDLPVTIVVLTIGSLFFYQKYYTQPLNQNKNNTGSRKRMMLIMGFVILLMCALLVILPKINKWINQESMISSLQKLGDVLVTLNLCLF